MITITLLDTNRTHIQVDSKTTNVGTSPSGYTAVEGSDNAAEITVAFPPQYINYKKHVVMTNSQNKSIVLDFTGVDQMFKFTLPRSMTKVPYTKLVFHAVYLDEVDQVWEVVNIPIAKTAVGGLEPIPDYDAITIMAIAQSVRDDADNGVFKGDTGDTGKNGDTGDTGLNAVVTTIEEGVNQYAMEVDQDGVLWLIYNEGTTPPDFNIDSDGNLYVDVKE